MATRSASPAVGSNVRSRLDGIGEEGQVSQVNPVEALLRDQLPRYELALERNPEGPGAPNARLRVLIIPFVLANGRPFHPAPRPRGEHQGAPEKCFETAQLYVIGHPDHLYVEGFALVGGELFHHAWAATPSDGVVDLRWPDPESCAYFGVPFSSSSIAALLRELGHYGDVLELVAARAQS